MESGSNVAFIKWVIHNNLYEAYALGGDASSFKFLPDQLSIAV